MYSSLTRPVALAAALAILPALTIGQANCQIESPSQQTESSRMSDRAGDPESSAASAQPEAPAPPAAESLATRILNRKLHFSEWVAAQVFLVICGILATLLALALAPRASTLAVAAIDLEPARAAVVGFAGLALLGVIATLNSALFSTVIWIPFGTVIALASTVTFFFSGLLGVAYFGGFFRKGNRPTVRVFFSRAVSGFLAIALFNLIPGVNVAAFFLQLLAFVLGLGGLLITGFGRDPDWLSKRLASAGQEWRD